MGKRFKKMLMLLLTAALIIPQVFQASVTEAATGTNVVYEMQADAGISGAAIGSEFAGTDYLQNSGGTRSIADYNNGKSIHLSTRTNDYNGLDVKLQALSLTAGVEYTFAISGHVDNDVTVPSSSQIVFSNPNAFGQFNNYQWLVNNLLTTGNFELEYKATFSASDIAGLANNSYFRIQTNENGKEVPFFVDNIIITKAVPTTTEVYEMQADTGISGAAIGSTFNNTDNLQNSGGTPTIVTQGDGKSIYVSGRDGNWQGVDIRLKSLGLITGKEYTFTVSGHVDSTENVPSNTRIVFSNPNPWGQYNQYQDLVSTSLIDGNFNLEYKVAFTADNIAKLEAEPADPNAPPLFRTATNDVAKNISFYVDNIIITSSEQQTIEIPEWDLTLDSLHEAYTNNFLIGNAISPNQITDPEFAAMVKLHYNVITAENDMKPQYMSPSKGVYNYTNADTLVDWALDNDIAVHGHTLVWHSQSADWLTKAAGGEPLTRTDAKANLIEYIENVAGHYAGKVISWDVANEVFADGGSFNGDWKDNLRKNSPWYLAYANGQNTAAGESGADYIYDAFVQTRLIDSGATLYYNDYNEQEQTKREAIAAMVEDLNEKWKSDDRNTEPDRLLIEGIGMQSHYNINSLNIEIVENAIKRFIDTGAKVTVSELDIPASDYENRTTPLTAAEKVVQAQLYAQLFQLYNKYADSIERITIWGTADPISWRGAGHPLLFDRLYAAKPAYYAVIDPEGYLIENPLPVPQVIPLADAMSGTAVIDGEKDQSWANAPVINVNTTPNGYTEQAATAEVRTMWDNQFLYVYAEVTDSELNNSSPNLYEQDSVEVFLSETMHRGAEYKLGDGQYRVNYEGIESFRSDSMSEGFESSARKVDSGYIVEMKIPFRAITPEKDTVVGFDVQINDASTSGSRKLTVWSDLQANGYNSTQNWGELTLKNAPTSTGPSTPIVNIPSEPVIKQENGIITIKPTVQVKDGVAAASISNNSLNKALEQASVNVHSKKQVTVDIQAQAGATSYEVQLPTSQLKESSTTLISIKTEYGTIDLPGNMLANTNVGNSEFVTVRLGKASTTGLSNEVREQISGRPVINLEILIGGKVVAWNNPNTPVTVSLPYTPSATELQNPDQIVVWYIDANGNLSTIKNGRYDTATKSVVFQTTHFSTYATAYVNNTFIDLQSVPWAKQAIEAMAARDIIKGTGNNSFSPTSSISRADFIALLIRGLELQGNGSDVAMFSDVPTNAYYYEELAIAKELGIATGFGDNSFMPSNSISRQDMMVLTTRALAAAGKGITSSSVSLSNYSDASTISNYAKNSAALLVEQGIINGKNGMIAPNDQLTRAEAAIILYRIWNL